MKTIGDRVYKVRKYKRYGQNIFCWLVEIVKFCQMFAYIFVTFVYLDIA